MNHAVYVDDKNQYRSFIIQYSRDNGNHMMLHGSNINILF